MTHDNGAFVLLFFVGGIGSCDRGKNDTGIGNAVVVQRRCFVVDALCIGNNDVAAYLAGYLEYLIVTVDSIGKI